MTSIPTAIEAAVRALHAAPQRAVLEVAGAGTQAIAWLHGLSGSSRTVLEAHDRYSTASIDQVLGFAPTQYVCAEVAQLLANRAYLRAKSLTNSSPVVGLGCTAAIATDRERKGQHRCFVAWQDGDSVNTYALVLNKGARFRQQEEALVSTLVLKALSVAFGTENLKLDLTREDSIAFQRDRHDLLDWLNAQPAEYVAIDPNGVVSAGRRRANLALLSGAFNPLHAGHRQLVEAASKQCGRPVWFEMPLQNADKASLSLQEARQRAEQFRGIGTVLLTRAPLFADKALLFPGSVFVVGADTAARLVQPRFYNDDPVQMEASLTAIQCASCRFLVAGRQQGAKFVTLDDIDIPPVFACLFEKIPELAFRIDLSSTVIREGRQG